MCSSSVMCTPVYALARLFWRVIYFHELTDYSNGVIKYFYWGVFIARTVCASTIVNTSSLSKNPRTSQPISLDYMKAIHSNFVRQWKFNKSLLRKCWKLYVTCRTCWYILVLCILEYGGNCVDYLFWWKRRMWLFRLAALTNFFSHCPHSNARTFSWTHWTCFSR